MAINKLALIRYKTIDECLQNRFRKWTLEDLIEKVSEAIYEYEGITTGVSKRTVQGDIQMMRSDKLGYNAPIIIVDKKYYAYEDKNYSIFKAPINTTDVEKLKGVLSVLKQFNGFSYFGEMAETIVKLENNLHKSSKKSRNCIQFESNQQLKGIEHINELYQAILQKKTLLLEYQSFTAKKPHQDMYFPYLLKEYRNRWFLIAKRNNHASLFTLALDRIKSFQELPQEPFVEVAIDFDNYFTDLIGVTKTEKDKAVKVILQVDRDTTPYILTKPLHHSQTILKQDENGAILSIEVVLNFELEREILGFGAGVKVLSPRLLAGKIKHKLQKAYQQYQKEEE
jgi:predicted DNA-binding transcriptional regulator YafY